MDDAIYRVTVRCVAPDNEARTHAVYILSDGTVLTPDHDKEPWAHSLDVIEALGGEGDVSACVWWRGFSEIPINSIGWNNGLIVVAHPSEDASETIIARYDVKEWEIEPLRDWTLEARFTIEQRLALTLPPQPAWQISFPTMADPKELLWYLQRIPGEHLHSGNGGYSVHIGTLMRLAMLFRGSDDTFTDWISTDQHWLTIEQWKASGYSADDTRRFCRAYETAQQELSEQFSEEVLASMVFHPPVSLAASLMDIGVQKERAIPLLERAPHIIYPDWPGVALKSMPEIEAEIPQTWVAEAICSIPAAGFMPEANRLEVARTLLASLPDRLSQDGDPQGWDPDWCWPADSLHAHAHLQAEES